MKNIRLTATAAILVLGAGTGWFYHRADAKEAPAYRTAAVTKGNLQSTVSATGTLGAVTTVQVGTQVSGQVSAIYVDFNAHVKKGELLARIDPTLQQQGVQDAQAGLDKAKATLTQAQSEFEREKQLFDGKVITASEFATAQSTQGVAVADMKSAQIAMQRAQQNLSYTNIYAPIDGVVIERDVDVGQTVAASFSAPQLFLIANDLSQMQILASVDESDIGQIQSGQPVTFTVQAYPNQSFSGVVNQVRLQSKTADNVVNYTAVVAVPNTTGKLLPGMTATLQFQTGATNDALIVPNSALRFKPTADVLKAAGITTGASTGAARGTGATTGASTAARPAGATHAHASGNHGVVWVLQNGKPTPVRVTTGLSDGQQTAVTGTGLAAGDQVITGTSTGATATAAAPATKSPLQPQSGGRRPGGF